ncbi:unnamed protein product [Dovyalis caffra]|uniref:protein disulfide-isomerase n=1 Tax=Dovyalis caffra TaxID=77055 RepID=A0AAV1SVS3_9ROSI|nr:unnamed protein product [Dovyalis caffra]
MFPAKPTSRFILFTLTILFLLTCTIFVTANEDPTVETDNDGVDNDLQELIAIDEQGGGGGAAEQKQGDQQKEAEVLSKAQRIVLELNSDNVKRVIDQNEFVLILGYAPWCARSAELMPQFAEAANKLKELRSPVLMAKLDAERYPKVASTLGIKGFPTLLLFVNGTSQVYTGGFSGEDIVIWARKKTGVPVIRISSSVEAEDFLKKCHMFVLGLFDKFEGHDYEEFIKAATTDNEIQFVEVSSSAVAKILFPNINATDHFIGIVKSEPERYTAYGGIFEKDTILQFLEYNKFPLVTMLTELNSARVYSSPVKLQVIVFADADDFKNLIQPLQEVARKFISKIMFIYIDIADENQAKPFLTLFGLEDSENTVVTAFDNGMSSKYLLESNPTPSNIQEFCSRLLHGSLSPYFKSQPVPDNVSSLTLFKLVEKEKIVQIVVGKTFDDLVLSSPKNVLLEVYTPWCINCETTSKQVEKLAKHFKGLDNLVFARIDASANEHPKLQVDDYPTLLFYSARDKANPIKLSTKSSSKDLAAVIKSHLTAKEEVPRDEL